MVNQEIKVLLVEDDMVDQMAFKRMIKKEDLAYDYTVSGSVEEAKKELDSGKFDVIISDFMLGDGTAFDVFEVITDTPFILVTGAGNEETAVKAMKAGAYDYLIKDPELNYLTLLPLTIENAIQQRLIREQNRMLSHALTNINDSVFITDMNKSVIFVNEAFCESYGFDEQGILGQQSDVFFKPDGAEASSNPFEGTLKDGVWQGELIHIRQDKSEFPVSLTGSVILDDQDTPVAWVGVARDITTRRQAEEEREHLIEELQDALNNIKTLKGLIPICAWCKKIRDDEGYWNKIEEFVREHSEVQFSHGICPDCKEKVKDSMKDL